jgi:hypothetical protein
MRQSQRSKPARVAAYLRGELEASEGALYVKSRYIADDIDLSAKEIGAAMAEIDEQTYGLSVEPWAYSGGTTWHVSRA